MSRQIVLDTETTGLSPAAGHRIIEIGCVELINRQRTGNDFHQYINPERAIDSGAQAVHGIKRKFLADKPVFQEIFESLTVYLQNAELIIHNAPFDLGFLNHEFKLLQKKAKKIETYCAVIDTLKLARSKHMGQRNNLDALCKRYHVNASKRDLHGALLDAELLAEVYLAMTGGQVDLFSETKSFENQKVAENVVITREGDLDEFVVLAPTDEEKIAHQDFLKKIANVSGKPCVWFDADEHTVR